MRYIFLSLFFAGFLLSEVQARQEKFTWREEHLLRSRVKLLDEFIDRFNLKATIADGVKIPEKGLAFDEMRMKHIASLFDKAWVEKVAVAEKSLAIDFINQVGTGKQKQFLSYPDKNWFAHTQADALYKGKKQPISFTMVMEHYNGLYQWSIAAVYAQWLDISAPKNAQLSPISHELNFSKLPKAVEANAPQIGSYASDGFVPDQRQAFFYLVKNEGLKLGLMQQKPAYHFLQVPGWIFVVSHVERNDENAGWLITKLIRANDAEKQAYKKGVLRMPMAN